MTKCDCEKCKTGECHCDVNCDCGCHKNTFDHANVDCECGNCKTGECHCDVHCKCGCHCDCHK